MLPSKGSEGRVALAERVKDSGRSLKAGDEATDIFT